jgi:type IV pilus assembly protein PilC
LQAAHAAGVIHRDVKPSNILISGEGRTAKLTDFGIGQVVSAEYLDGMTRAGFTQTMLGPGFSGQSGTQMYLAPELIAGKPASARSDIYSLGVVLYQLLAGDFNQPLTTDWAARIADPLLKEDLLRCFAGDPQARFASARDLAGNLRSLKERQAALAAQKAALDALAQLRAAAATSQRFVFLTRSLKAIAYFAALAAFSFFAAFLAFMVAGAQSLDFVAHATHCRLNLKIIDQAKRQWALDKQKSAGAAVDTNAVLAYIEGGMPVCLSGGKYALNDVGVAPSCNLREHLADQDFKRLRLAVPYAFPIKPVEGPVRLTLAAAASSAAALGGVGVVLLLVRLYREKLGQRSKADPGVVPAADLVLFTRQLATMLDAGFGVSEALQALWGQIPREATRAVIKDVGLRVEQGTSFSAALQEHPGVFDQAFCCIVEAAEKGGTLCEAMARLAGQLENAARLRRKVRSGLAFPAMLACAAIWATAFLLVKMVPMLGEQFARLGRQLPKPTQDLISLCNWVQGNYLYPIAIVAAVLCGWLAIIKSNAGRAFWDWFRIKLPILGPLALKLALSRFARTAASLLRSGLPAAEALRLSGHAVRNRPLEAALRAAASDVERGDSISMALGKHPIFPGLIVRLLAPAEQTGMVQGMLERLADLLDEEVEAVLSNFASFIESLFLVFLAIMLGALAISMSLPVIQLDEVLSPR